MSPELAMKKDYYALPADIWGLGVMLFIIITGRVPFTGDFEDDLYRRISLCKYKFPENISLSNSFKNLIKKIFCPD